MDTVALTDEPIPGPITVPLGKRVVTNKRDYFPFPRQAFRIDRTRLEAGYYGDAALSRLERGYTITYCDFALTGPGRQVLEFPDGSRYAFAHKFLGGEKVSVDVVERPPNAAR
jgi:hypothetical protein